MIIVFGNTKGGTGKSTLAFHVAVDLLYRGVRLACIDGDGDQGTFSRCWENRQGFQHQTARVLPMPLQTIRLSSGQEGSLLQSRIETLKAQVIVIDTAGVDSPLSRYAHSLADVLVTPMNDSAVDLDLLVNIKDTPNAGQLPLSHYSALVWEQRIRKASHGGPPLQWMVVRNRMHMLSSRNQVQLENILSSLARRIGFHLADSVGERVIFRELFSYGLTILDKNQRSPSHESACLEIKGLTDMILSLGSKFSSSMGK